MERVMAYEIDNATEILSDAVLDIGPCTEEDLFKATIVEMDLKNISFEISILVFAEMIESGDLTVDSENFLVAGKSLKQARERADRQRMTTLTAGDPISGYYGYEKIQREMIEEERARKANRLLLDPLKPVVLIEIDKTESTLL